MLLLKRLILLILLLLAILMAIFPGGFILQANRSSMPNNVIPAPHHGISAYIINLEHSKERYAKIRPQVEALGMPWQRVDAVYGAHLSPQEWQETVDLRDYHMIVRSDPSPGTIGCYLSHLKVWQEFLASPYEYAVIFEDDVSFNAKELRDTIEALVAMPTKWDLITFEAKKKGTPLSVADLPRQQKLVVYLSPVSNSGAYIINRQAAAALLEKSLPIKMPLDYFFTRSWEFGIRFMGVEPRPVRQTFGDSEISKTDIMGTEYSGNKGRDSWRDRIHKQVYTTESELLRFFYNLWIYLQSYC